MKEKRTSRLWLRNTSRHYGNTEVFTLLKLCYESAARRYRGREDQMPRIILKFTNCNWYWNGRASWTEWHMPAGKPLSRVYNRETGRWEGQEKWKRILVRVGAPKFFEKPIDGRDTRFKDTPEYKLDGPREVIVHIIAHEMEHALGVPGGKNGELKCELAAIDAVEYYRARRAEVDAEIMEERLKTIKAQEERKEREQVRNSPDAKRAAKLENARKKLAEWTRKAKAATNRAKKYQRQVKRLERAMAGPANAELALAAKGQP
jgi:hypothetical protein